MSYWMHTFWWMMINGEIKLFGNDMITLLCHCLQQIICYYSGTTGDGWLCPNLHCNNMSSIIITSITDCTRWWEQRSVAYNINSVQYYVDSPIPGCISLFTWFKCISQDKVWQHLHRAFGCRCSLRQCDEIFIRWCWRLLEPPTSPFPLVDPVPFPANPSFMMLFETWGKLRNKY